MLFLFWLVFGAIISAEFFNIKKAFTEKHYPKLGLWVVTLLITFSLGGVIRANYLQQKKDTIRSQYSTTSSPNIVDNTNGSIPNHNTNSNIIQSKIDEPKPSAKTYNGWITVKVENELEFQIPPTLELQSKDYQNAIQQRNPSFYKLVNPGNNPRIVAQQKGLNERTQESLSHYARAILQISSFSDSGPKWGEPLNFTKQEFREYRDIFREDLRKNLPKDTKLIKISQDPKIINVNGVECINVKYDTQYKNNPIVNSELYVFYNGTKIYRFQTLIRSTEYDYWTSKDFDIRDIVNTIKPSK